MVCRHHDQETDADRLPYSGQRYLCLVSRQPLAGIWGYAANAFPELEAPFARIPRTHLCYRWHGRRVLPGGQSRWKLPLFPGKHGCRPSQHGTRSLDGGSSERGHLGDRCCSSAQGRSESLCARSPTKPQRRGRWSTLRSGQDTFPHRWGRHREANCSTAATARAVLEHPSRRRWDAFLSRRAIGKNLRWETEASPFRCGTGGGDRFPDGRQSL